MSRKVSTLAYECLSVEGGLLPPEWFSRLAQSALDEMQPEAYRLPAGLQLRDEISRAWTIARAWWQRYTKAREGHAPDSPPALKAANAFAQGMLREVFGFHSLQVLASPLAVGGRHFHITLQALEGRVPIVIAAWGESLDAPLERLKEGRRRSPFGMLQDYLNASDVALWGIVLNGRCLRILRDNAALTRPAWVEVELERMFAAESHADFAALWLLLHETRFGLPGAAAADSWIERQRSAALEEGTRAREKLRDGVAQALRELGCGFLKHADSHALRELLRTGQLSEAEYYAELLRLVYRILFVVTVEERGLLHPDSAEQVARTRYREGFAFLPLRDRAARAVTDDGHHDLWLRVTAVFAGLATGQRALALPAFGGLFDRSQTPHLDTASVGNGSLLRALRALTWVPLGNGLARVNWRDMGAEELGSVYESLLELVPQVRIGEPDAFSFVGDSLKGSGGADGNARKLSGSYYTPDSLVQALLDSTLEPVISSRVDGLAADASAAEDALLSITCVDPAMGSGHFILGAARRLATHLARLRTDGTPSAAEYRSALRDVITHCIYGTDKNALAVELARMALWLEAAKPDAPLGFIDHHLRHGDALLGLFDLGVLHEGIPDEAYDSLAGDDKRTASTLKRRNRQERLSLEAQRTGGPQMALLPLGSTDVDAYTVLDQMPDDTAERVVEKRAASEALAERAANSGVMLAANLYVAAFLLPKRPGTDDVATTRDVIAALQGQKVPAPVRSAAEAVARQERFTHWKLVFPQVFARGGFDVVIGNPPWEKVKLSEKEFFATRAPDVISARTAAERRKSIQMLSQAPQDSVEWRIYSEYLQALRAAEGIGAWLHTRDRFPLTGRGDVNLYAVFAETMLRLAQDSGRCGLIAPTGIATDDSTKTFLGHLVSGGRLASIVSFENEDLIFPAVHHFTRFCLLTIGHTRTAELLFFARRIDQLSDVRRWFRLGTEDFTLINPNTLTCPIFRSERDAELTKIIHRRVPVLVDEQKGGAGNPWEVSFARLFDMSNDSGLFHVDQGEGRLPLYEAKLIHQFDHRWATYECPRNHDGEPEAIEVALAQKNDASFESRPRYWVDSDEVHARLRTRDWKRDWLIGWRDITNATNERTVIASVLPIAAVGNKIPLFMLGKGVEPRLAAAFLANLCALALDFCARQKIGGTTLNYFFMKQFPLLRPDHYAPADLDFIVPRVAELTVTSHTMRSWGNDLGWRGSPHFDRNRRALLRAELDAWYAHLYGLSRGELSYVLDPALVLGPDYPSQTFRVLKSNEIAEFGEYRTARLVLEAWDRLVEPTRRTRGAA